MHVRARVCRVMYGTRSAHASVYGGGVRQGQCAGMLMPWSNLSAAASDQGVASEKRSGGRAAHACMVLLVVALPVRA